MSEIKLFVQNENGEVVEVSCRKCVYWHEILNGTGICSRIVGDSIMMRSNRVVYTDKSFFCKCYEAKETKPE